MSNANGNAAPAATKDTNLPTRATIGGLIDANALIRYTADGSIKAASVRVYLEKELKHFYEVPGAKRDEPKTIALTADGFYFLNRIAGLQIVNPPTLVIDGQELRNPYIHRSSEGNIIEVVVRKLAVGRAPLGNVCVTDSTLCFSPRAYFVRDIVKKMKGYYDKGKGGFVRNEKLAKIRPSSAITEEERKNSWILDQGMGLSLVVDVTNDDFLNVFGNYQELLLFAERRAQTICERMALARHPAIAQKVVVPDATSGKVRVDIIAWQETDVSREDMRRRALGIARGEEPKDDTAINVTFTTDGDEEPEAVTVPDGTEPATDRNPGSTIITPPPADPPPANAPAETQPSKQPRAEPQPELRPNSPEDVGFQKTAGTSAKSAVKSKQSPSLSEKQRAGLIDEIEAASNQMDESDYLQVMRGAGWNGQPVEQLGDDVLQALAAALRSKLAE